VFVGLLTFKNAVMTSADSFVDYFFQRQVGVVQDPHQHGQIYAGHDFGVCVFGGF
jgi:hypothetical protein